MASKLVSKGQARLSKAPEDDPASPVPAAAPQHVHASIPASSFAGISASENASVNAGIDDSSTDSQNTGENASMNAFSAASNTAGGKASYPASRKGSAPASRKAGKSARGKARRRVGRPRGPARVAITIRILEETDARLTAAVEATGQSPQYLVDAALDRYFDTLGV